MTPNIVIIILLTTVSILPLFFHSLHFEIHLPKHNYDHITLLIKNLQQVPTMK